MAQVQAFLWYGLISFYLPLVKRSCIKLPHALTYTHELSKLQGKYDVYWKVRQDRMASFPSVIMHVLARQVSVDFRKLSISKSRVWTQKQALETHSPQQAAWHYTLRCAGLFNLPIPINCAFGIWVSRINRKLLFSITMFQGEIKRYFCATSKLAFNLDFAVMRYHQMLNNW